jgi:hypothetical protein
VPRARLRAAENKTREWKSEALRAYQRRTIAADALIAGTYLAGTNTRRVRRALAALFGGAVGFVTLGYSDNRQLSRKARVFALFRTEQFGESRRWVV